MEFQSEEDHNELLFEKASKFGRYHFVLFSLLYAIILITKANDLLLIFGAYEPANFSCSAIKNQTEQNDEGKFEFSSMVESWALCGSLDYVPSLMISIQLFGSLVGGFFSGPISDRYGRKFTLISTGIFLIIFGIASMASTGWQVL